MTQIRDIRPVPWTGRSPQPSDGFLTLVACLVAWIGLSAIHGLPTWVLMAMFELSWVAIVVTMGRSRRISPREFLPFKRLDPSIVALVALSSAAATLALTELSLPLVDLLHRMGVKWEDAPYISLPSGIREVQLVLLAPLGEEMLFRGALLQSLRTKWGSVAALATSSILFGLIHPMPPQVLLTMVLGLHFGWVVARTGSLLAGLIAHALNNAIALVSLSAPERPMNPALLAGAATAYVVLAILLVRRTRKPNGAGPGPSGAV